MSRVNPADQRRDPARRRARAAGVHGRMPLEEERLAGPEGADAGEVCAGRAAPRRPSRDGAERAAAARGGVPVGAEDVGSEMADEVRLLRRSGRRRACRAAAPAPSSRRCPGPPAGRHAAGARGVRLRRGPPATVPPSAGGSGRVIPESSRWRSACPRPTTSPWSRPDEVERRPAPGQRSSARTSGSPTRAACSRRAVRQTVSPSGTAPSSGPVQVRSGTRGALIGHRRSRSPRGVGWNPAASGPRRGGGRSRASRPPSAFSTVSRPSAPSRTASARASAADWSARRRSAHDSRVRPPRST